MLKKLFTRFVNIFRHPITLSWILAIMIFSIHFPLAKAQVSESKSDPDGKKYVWYQGDQEKHIRLADDEIAIFPRQRANRTRGVLEKAVKDLGFGGEIVKQNDFVMYMKLSKRRTRGEIETMTGVPQKEGEIQGISPVFYSGSKDSGTRMALTGEIIIHFSPDWDRSKIDGWSKKKGLSLIKSFDFSPNTFLFDAGSPMKSLELANDIYLSGEVLYSYPNWLKTRVTREEFYKNSHEGFDDKKIRDKGKESNEKSIRKIREKNKAKADTKEQREYMLPSEKQQEEDASVHNIVNRSVTRSIAKCYPWSKNFWTGSTGGIYGGYDKDIYIEGIDGDEGIELRGFAKFDTSSIPDNSLIYDVELHVYCFEDVGMPNVAIRKLNSDPVVASWETIFEEAGNGTLYVNNWPFSDGYFDTGQWNVKSLGQMAAMDLQASLGQDWFALGFEQDDFSTSSYAWCYGWDSFLYKPYIVVDYDLLPCEDDDPLFPIQWHLKNTGQCGIAGEDVNIYPVWSTYKGSSSVIAIVDSGVEIAHEDLIENVLPEYCWDYIDGDMDPTSTCAHGTACAGVAAARGWNCLGGRGAAPFCKIVGYRFIGAETEENEADALSRNNDIVDIYVNSWGPPDTGKDLIGPDPLTEASLADSAVNGRGGLGNIYVWAGGNGYEDKDNSNYDGYTNFRYTIAVAASDDLGKHPYYSEKGANILVNAPSSGGNCDITTCDLTGPDGYNSGNYTSQFTGTSASAPLVSGIIALMLEANPNLSWRDVQHILIKTAKQNDPTDPDWKINGAGYHVNHIYGFGRVDAEKAITTSLSWKSVGPEVSIEKSSCPNIAIPDSNIIGVSDTMLIDKNIKIEFIEVYFSATDHSNWGDLGIELISPTGTSSILAEKHDSNGTSTYDNWRFGTIRHFGEDSKGTWKLNVKDLAYIDRGTFQKWSLKIFGYEDPNENNPPVISGTPQSITPVNTPYSFIPTADDPDGDILDFSIENKPSWVNFDKNTGALTGIPSCDDLDASNINIIIKVSDGEYTASLKPFNLTVKDDEPPEIICPSAITVNTDPEACSGNVNLGWPTVSDNCDPDPIIENNAPSPPILSIGSIEITWAARDSSDNLSTCTQIVTIIDDEAPTILCPPDITVNNDPGACSAYVDLGLPTVFDNCDSNVSNDAPSPPVFQIGPNPVNWKAIDPSGHEATCTQTVTVVDNEIPAILCPPDITVNNDPGACSAYVDLGWPTVFDNCDPNVSNDAPSPPVFQIGPNPVNWKAIDPSGNEVFCTQTITVENKILEVGPTGFSYMSIQKAIDDACNGDTILVHDGTYIENINLVYKNLVIKSQNGAMHTIIEGNPNVPVISFYSIDDPNNARFSGFTITNGKNNGYGGGIYCKDSNLTLSNNIIRNNHAEYGAGICCIFSSPTIINNTIVNNSSPVDGSGIYADTNSFPIIMNTIIWDNQNGKELYGIEPSRISYSVTRNEEFQGQNNISQNPMFVDPNKENYHLKNVSPCSNTGNPDGYYYDLDGSRNDIGADGGPWGIIDTNAPIINEIIATPSIAKTGEEVSFITDVYDEWGIANYFWDFDLSDGIQENAQGDEVSYAYENEGNYIITLTVRDNSGLESMATKEITISKDEPPEPPEILSISTNPSPLCGNVPLEVIFNVDAVDPDGYIDSYVFYFTDSNQIITDSKYSQINFTINREIFWPEAFEIGVCVKDNDGLTDCDTIPITLIPPGYHIEASGMIGIEGGEIEVLDIASTLYGTKVSVSKNVLNKDVVITISRVEACPPFTDQYIGIGIPVDFGPLINFSSPVTITIPYDSSELEAKGISTGEDLIIYLYDTMQSEWRPIENTTIDLENECVSARISNFTLFKIGYDNNQDDEGGEKRTEGSGCFINTLFPNIRLIKNK